MIHERTRTKEDIYSTASSSEASDSLVFLYKFVEHEAKINIEISVELELCNLSLEFSLAHVVVAESSFG